eukprot:2619804-Pyramimonas_sp.AAC.1
MPGVMPPPPPPYPDQPSGQQAAAAPAPGPSPFVSPMPLPQQGPHMFGNSPLINNPFAKTQMSPCAP